MLQQKSCGLKKIADQRHLRLTPLCTPCSVRKAP